MALPLYLAMTAAEISQSRQMPAHCAYMACHFSPYETGLSNIPQELPKGSLLILNDRTPVLGHDPDLIAQQLSQAAEVREADGVLLDFQRPGQPETHEIARAIVSALTCPVAVSEHYANDLDCSVFLSPPPLDRSLSAYIKPWQGRDIWLEAALDTIAIQVTEKGSRQVLVPYKPGAPLHTDTRLHCNYRICAQPDQVMFTLERDANNLSALLEEAAVLGIARAVGLYQELGSHFQ